MSQDILLPADPIEEVVVVGDDAVIVLDDIFTEDILAEEAWGLTKASVGLGNVDNTADLAKPVSAEQANAIAQAKADAIAHADSLTLGLLNDRGSHDASTALWPATGGTGEGGAIRKGDLWIISVAGTLGGVVLNIGDSIRALIDSPGQSAVNWAALEGNLGYVPAAADHNHDTSYAPIAKGVTNGDSHDHSGGDGAQIAYSSLSGLPTLGTAAALNVPASGNAATGEVVKGNDTRLSDARAPTAHNHDASYAPIAKGVTNGDSHDHSGGDGAQIAYSSLSGLPTLGTAAALNVPASGNAAAGEVVKGNDTRLAGGAADVQVFTGNGTWTKPSGKTFVQVILIGGGGGGGSGRRGATSTLRTGGSGGGAGGYTEHLFTADSLSATVSVTVGAGGTGGTAISANDTNGNAGQAGGQTTFGSYLQSGGGGAGNGGLSGSVAAGTAGNSAVYAGGAGGSVTAAGVGNVGASSSNPIIAATGGGAGAGIDASNAVTSAGAGGAAASGIGSIRSSTLNGGTAGTTGTGGAGGNGNSAGTSILMGGTGGGGGASHVSAAGGAGGNGGGYGAGGGGGAASLNGANSGKGGDGAGGVCVVIAW